MSEPARERADRSFMPFRQKLMYLRKISATGLVSALENAFLAFVTKTLFLSFCESTLMPNAVLAITSIVNAPQNLITETIFNIYLNKICYSKNVYWRMHMCRHTYACIYCVTIDFKSLYPAGLYTSGEILHDQPTVMVPFRLLTLSN